MYSRVICMNKRKSPIILIGYLKTLKHPKFGNELQVRLFNIVIFTFYLVLSKTHFGEKIVDAPEKQGLVNQVFSNVADTYDVMNDVMSFGIHR